MGTRPVLGQKVSDDASSTLPTLVHVVPPSPTAAALGRFGEIPVGLYTGLPTITVPLLAAKNSSGAGQVDLGLNYHALGIRVDDIGSWVGLGWSLECGGVVSRTIHGSPDESAQGYLHLGGDRLDRYLTGGQTQSAQELDNFSADVAAGTIDVEPDVYSFNFRGHAGQFVFNRAGQPVLMPQQPLLIEARADTSGFKITDEEGTVYHFLVPESSTSETIPNRAAPEVYTSSWYLDRIVPVTGPAIHFVYSAPKDVLYPASTSENKRVTTNYYGVASATGSVKSMPSLTNVRAAVVTLQQIRLADQTVRFYCSERGDVAGMSKLDSLTQEDAQARVTKRFAFRYENGGSASGRVFLSQVQEVGPSTATVPPYVFTYIPGVPPLYSYAQDHWGYYNQNVQPTLIPTTGVNIVPPLPTEPYVLTVSGADRRPDSVRVMKGLLARITYPTGGSTAFTYEPHDYGYIGRAANRTQLVTRAKTVAARAKWLPTTNVFELDSAQFRIAEPNPGGNTKQIVTFAVSINVGTTGNTRDGTFANGNVYYRCLTCNPADGQATYRLLANATGTASVPLELPAGLYRIYAYYEPLRAESPGYASITASFQDSVGLTPNQVSGGVRVRRTVSDAGNGAPPVVKTYAYRLAAEPARSSGVAVAGLPTYQYRYNENVNIPNTQEFEVAQYVMLTSTSGAQPGMTQGAPVGYSEVTMLEGADGTAGKTVHTFSSARQYPDHGDGSAFPFAPNNSADYLRGKAEQVTAYRRRNGADEPIGRTVSSYSFDSPRAPAVTERVVGLKVGYTFRYTAGGGAGHYNSYAAQLYTYTSDWVYPTASVAYQYGTGADATAYHATSTRYRYDNPLHKQLTAQEQTASDGSTVSTRYRYPLDLLAPTNGAVSEPVAGIQALLDHHVLRAPLEQQTWRRRGNDSVLVAAQLTHYAGVYPRRVWQLTVDAPVPATTFLPAQVRADGSLQQDPRYREAVLFEQYDAAGHLLQQRRALDQPVSYLWGYGGTLPIAQIQNATYAQLQQGLAALGVEPAALVTDAQVSAAMNQLRQHLPAARLTAFTHRPLIGLSSQTDPSGRTIFYEYDALNRLVRTRDEQGRILSQQQYHYAGQ